MAPTVARMDGPSFSARYSALSPITGAFKSSMFSDSMNITGYPEPGLPESKKKNGNERMAKSEKTTHYDLERDNGMVQS